MSHDALQTAEPAPPPPVRPARPRWLPVFGLLAVVAFLLGAFGGGYQGKLADVQKNDNSAFLPSSAESTKVANEAKKFATVQDIPGFLVYRRDGALTAADRAKIAADRTTIAGLTGVDANQMGQPQLSSDGTTAALSVPLIASRGGVDLTGPELSDNEKAVVKVAQTGNPAGLEAHSAGAGGLLVAFIDAFQGIDGKLLGIAGVVVIVLLLLVYRSPVLWIFPLFSAGVALGLASIVIYLLAKHDVITLNGQSQGIMSVLVIGAGTDYALLLISRYREELHEYPSRIDAMVRAWRGAAPAIFASACTVVIGLLCLLVSELNSNRGLGPVCAIAIASTLFVMLFFLPVALVVFGRWIFWPRRPHVDHAVDIATHGLWGRVANSVGTHPRRYWAITVVVLLGAVALVPGLRTQGMRTTDAFTNTPDALVGQRIFDSTFDQGAGTPAIITANADQAQAIIAAAAKVKGVSTGAGAVCLQPDYAKVAQAAKAAGSSGSAAAASGPSGCLPDPLSVQPIGGRTVINAQITDAYDSQGAYGTIKRLRTAVHAVHGAGAQVGGQGQGG